MSGKPTCRCTYASGASPVTILTSMHLVYQLLTLVHLIGFAALLGGSWCSSGRSSRRSTAPC